MNKLPPQSINEERAVLGSIISNNELIYRVIDFLSPEDFYEIQNEKIYKEIIKLFNSGKRIDILTLKDCSDYSYLTSLIQGDFISVNIKQYAETVKDKSIRRQLINAQNKNEEFIYNEKEDIESVLAKTQNSIVEINLIKNKDDSIQNALNEMDKLKKEYADKYAQGKEYLGIPCGIKKIDDYIDGMRPGHIWVVGAFTSTGKTQFMLNVAQSVMEQSESISIISLEMSKVDLTARLIGIRTNQSSMKILKGLYDKELESKVFEARTFLGLVDCDIHTTYFDIEKIKMIIRKDVYTRRIKAVFIDYVQNIVSEKGKREYEVLTQSATELQALARELGITIYIVSQISNEAEKGEGAGAGFKGTGSLEAVADIAIRLKRNKKEELPDDEWVNMDIVITKNRHGYTGIISDYVMWLKSGKFDLHPRLKI
jgi:replicative DNA helicase